MLSSYGFCYGPQKDLAFVTSFLIIPLYLFLVRVGKWLVTESLGTVRKTAAEENTRYFTVAFGLVRAIILFTLAALPYLGNRSALAG